MTAINDGIFRHYRNGGVFTITDNEAAASYDLSGMEENSLGFTPGMNEVFLDRENGAMQTNLRRGDGQPTRLQLRTKLTAGALAAAGWLGMLLDQTKAVDDGLIRSYNIVCKFPTLPDGAAGKTVTFAACVVEPGSVELAGGQEYDVLTVRFLCPSVAPTFGTY